MEIDESRVARIHFDGSKRQVTVVLDKSCMREYQDIIKTVRESKRSTNYWATYSEGKNT